MIDKFTALVVESIDTILASIFSSTANLSTLWSALSFANSDFLIKPLTPLVISTSNPFSVIFLIIDVTILPLTRSLLFAIGSLDSCLTPKLTLSFSISISNSLAFTISPFL